MILELRDALQEYLKTKHSSIYYNIAEKSAVFPYVVFNLPFQRDEYSREDFVLEIDIWDNSSNTATIEGIADLIDGNGGIVNPSGLNRKSLNTTAIMAKLYRTSRQSIEDVDKTIKRRRLVYTVKVYMK